LLLANLGTKSTFPGSPGWRAARAKAWIDERFTALVESARAGGGDQGLLRSLALAEALFREVVRVHPPFGMITRSAEEDVAFAERTIRKGTVVGVDLWTASRNPGVFASPDAFRPARWLERKGPPTQLEIVPFGMGPHFCIGYHLAWLEAVQFTVALVREAERQKLRPRLRGTEPRPVYLPTEHPPARTRVAFG